MVTEIVERKKGNAKCAKGKDCVSLTTMIEREDYLRLKMAVQVDRRSLSNALRVGIYLYTDKVLAAKG